MSPNMVPYSYNAFVSTTTLLPSNILTKPRRISYSPGLTGGRINTSSIATPAYEARCQRLQIARNLSTTHHPQTDDQMEVLNAIMEQYLCCFIDYYETNWEELLLTAEFAANNHSPRIDRHVTLLC